MDEAESAYDAREIEKRDELLQAARCFQKQKNINNNKTIYLLVALSDDDSGDGANEEGIFFIL